MSSFGFAEAREVAVLAPMLPVLGPVMMTEESFSYWLVAFHLDGCTLTNLSFNLLRERLHYFLPSRVSAKWSHLGGCEISTEDLKFNQVLISRIGDGSSCD